MNYSNLFWAHCVLCQSWWQRNICDNAKNRCVTAVITSLLA